MEKQLEPIRNKIYVIRGQRVRRNKGNYLINS